MRASVALLLCACSGLRAYPTNARGNLEVVQQVDSGVSAALHVHRLNARCEPEYVGTVALDHPVALDLRPGEPAWLVVTFDTSSFFAGNRSTSFATALTPRPGNRYDMQVRYHQSIYDVALAESDARTGLRRALPRRECQAALR